MEPEPRLEDDGRIHIQVRPLHNRCVCGALVPVGQTRCGCRAHVPYDESIGDEEKELRRRQRVSRLGLKTEITEPCLRCRYYKWGPKCQLTTRCVGVVTER